MLFESFANKVKEKGCLSIRYIYILQKMTKHELVLDVQGAKCRLLHEHELLCQAEEADVEAWAVGPGDKGPAQPASPF